MARARNIKPSFFQNEDLSEIPPLARLFFIGLWTVADYKGCVEFRPKRLKVQLLPYDDCSTEELTNYLDKSGFVQMYSVGGQRYMKIVNFEKHQNPHKNERDGGSDVPDVDQADSQTIDSIGIAINPEKDGSDREQDGIAPADSLFPLPVSPTPLPEGSAPPASPAPQPESANQKKVAKKEKTPFELACRATLESYASAYEQRYGAMPVFNAELYSKIQQLVKKLGHEESPLVAGFYVSHSAEFYVRTGHSFGALVKDAAKLRTEWITGRKVTSAQARQADRTQANSSAADEAMRILEAQGVR